jgi:hypothetical protein
MSALHRGAIAFCIIGLAILAHAFAVCFRAFLSPLRNVPGPRLAAVSRLWEFYTTVRGDISWRTVNLHQQYGQLGLLRVDILHH